MIVNICGVPHKVKYKKDSFGDELHLGEIDYRQAKIRINKDVAPEIQEETLCHEIIHGILIYIGRQDLSQDEQFVTALGNAVYQSFEVKRW